MFWKSKPVDEFLAKSLFEQAQGLEYELRMCMLARGQAEGECEALRSETKELRETNRRLLDHISAVNGATPIFNPTVPATADGTKPVTFNQTPRDFVEEAEALERKALRDRQNELLEMFAARRAREMEEPPKESAA